MIPEEITRVKVCRMETVCKLTLPRGSRAPRARVKNLVAPLHYDAEDSVDVTEDVRAHRCSEASAQPARQAERDGEALSGSRTMRRWRSRAERIYANASRSLEGPGAPRGALAVKDALALSNQRRLRATAAGASLPARQRTRPLSGRTLNRRIEVEFWHDDPLQRTARRTAALPGRRRGRTDDEVVYDPPWGQHRAPPHRGRRRGRDSRPAIGEVSAARARGRGRRRARRTYGSVSSATRANETPRSTDRASSTATTSASRPSRARRAMERIEGELGLSRGAGRARGARLRALERRGERRLHPGRYLPGGRSRSSTTNSRCSTTSRASKSLPITRELAAEGTPSSST